MRCSYFEAGRCRSCTLIERPYPDQLAAKQRHVEEVLGRPALAWSAPFASAESKFRNKAKMVVAGTVAEPTVGILDPTGRGVDLRDCPLHEPALRAALPALADFVTLAGLTPYDVPARRGELKHLLVTASPAGELMVRFVLRSTEALPRIRKRLPALRAALPNLAVASANLLPGHQALTEGAEEIPLLGDTLTMLVNGLDLHLRPRSFFQTNTAVAAGLYREAAAWVDEAVPAEVWDLYCGVGGFALHVAAPGRAVTGVETSAEAVAAARATADAAGLTARFVTGDATALDDAAFAAAPPDVVIVNPPRRGLGPDLAARLDASGVGAVVYSSCNPASLARDLAAMPGLRPVRARLFDMFPHTTHAEILTLLTR